jgi:hypothetical protein
MARRKNTKFIDPRYFMNEKMERLDERMGDVHGERSPVPGKSAPRYGAATLNWDSDVDMGLYIVYNAMRKSKSEPELLQWLSSLGYTQDEMMQQGEAIKSAVKELFKAHPQFQGFQTASMDMRGASLDVPQTAQPPSGEMM